MIIVWWSVDSLIHYSFLNPGKTITSEKYAQQINDIHQKLPCLLLALSTERAQFFSTTISEFMSHNQCFKSLTNWAVKFCLIRHIHLPSHQLMDRGAWQAAVHGVTKSRTRLRNFHFTSLTNKLPLLQASRPLFCRENTSTTNRIQKMLSKSLWNPKAGIFKLQE